MKRDSALPLGFVDDYLPALLAQAHQLLSREFHAVVVANGVAVPEWRVLATLAANEPMSIGRIAQITTIKQPTVTRLLDRMEAKRFIERLPSEGDRRVTLIALTPHGNAVAAHLTPLAREHEERVLAPFGRDRGELLKATLREIVELHAVAVSPDSRAADTAGDDDGT
jgi:DNA-binding MarR family transcriptional regulator